MLPAHQELALKKEQHEENKDHQFISVTPLKKAMKPIEEWNFEELVEWAEGHVLKQLIAGKLYEGIWKVCDETTRWWIRGANKINPNHDISELDLSKKHVIDPHTGQLREIIEGAVER